MIAKIVTGEIEDIATDYGKNAAAVALGRMGGKARAAQWSTAYRRTMLPGTVLEDVMIQWFDDLTVGMRYKGGEAEVTREDIKRFAAEFDPQPFHLDEAAAEKSMFKGLAASGWHTAAIAMRLAVALRPFGPHPLLGLAVDELRWLAPVRPGDVLRIEGEVVELTPSRTKPQGTARVKWTVYNQNGEPVLTFTPTVIVPRHPNS